MLFNNVFFHTVSYFMNRYFTKAVLKHIEKLNISIHQHHNIQCQPQGVLPKVKLDVSFKVHFIVVSLETMAPTGW